MGPAQAQCLEMDQECYVIISWGSNVIVKRWKALVFSGRPLTPDAFFLVLSDAFPELTSAFDNLHPYLPDNLFRRFSGEAVCHEVVDGLSLLVLACQVDLGQGDEADQSGA